MEQGTFRAMGLLEKNLFQRPLFVLTESATLNWTLKLRLSRLNTKSGHTAYKYN
jgi:hypothetical protein